MLKSSSLSLPAHSVHSLQSSRLAREVGLDSFGRAGGRIDSPDDSKGSTSWRYEFKYVVARHLRAPLTADLSAFIRCDPYADDRGYYLVRSLYFDTYDWKCLLEKSAGSLNRCKLRIRTYPEAGDASAIKFEIKRRAGNRTNKSVAAIDRPTFDQLRAGLNSRRMADAWHFDANPSLRPFYY